ncbi:MAG: GNAT family N-acetyltransferase [Phycisphaerales bacterium]
MEPGSRPAGFDAGDAAGAMPDPIEIARFEEARLTDALAHIAPVVERFAGGVMARGEPGSWMNKSMGFAMQQAMAADQRSESPRPSPADTTSRIIKFYESAAIEPRVEVSAYADMAWVRALGDAGFRVLRFANVLVRPLGDAGRLAAEAIAAVDGLTIEAVDPADAASVEAYARTGTAGFARPGRPSTDLDLGVWARALERPGTIALLARVDGVPASAGIVEVTAPYATLFGLSVLPDFRRRGIQRAMQLARLDHARRVGATFATITSDPNGPTERNARRVGFTPMFARAILVRPGPGLTPVAW